MRPGIVGIPGASALLAGLCALLLGLGQSSDAVVRVVGSRIGSDSDLSGNGWGIHNAYLGSYPDGGRLLLVLANDGGSPLTIERLEIAGSALDDLTDDTLFSERIESLNWWQAAPRTVGPGELTTVRIRLLELADFGDPVEITLGTDAGDVAVTIIPQRGSPLWLPFVGFAADDDGGLSRAVVYVANSGSVPLLLPPDGGIRLDEHPLPGRPVERTIAPGGVVPVEIDLDPAPTPGDWLVIEVVAESGESALGSLRAFASGLSFGFWQLGENSELSAPHLASYGIDTTTPGASVVVDEPFRVRMAPRELAARLESRRDERPEAPTMVQLSGYEEVLLYSDLADITMTHHRDLEQELSLALSWPKPIWYLPQDAWGRNTRPDADEKWYPLEDLEHQALTGLAGGSKHLQWFTYWNLWQQGHGRGGAIDATRNQLDLSMSGAVGNPTLLDRVGRVSLTLRLLEPYLALSAPLGRITSPSGIEATTLLSGVDRGVVVLLDRYSPVALYERSAGSEHPRTLTSQTIEALAPSWLRSDRAYLLDPFEGVRELPIEAVGDERIRLRLDRFATGSVVVLGDAADGEALRAGWNALSFPDPGAALDRIGAWAERAVRDWRVPDRRYRLPLEIVNDGDRTHSVFDILLDRIPGELTAGSGLTLLEIGEGETRDIPVQYTPELAFFAPTERDGDRLDSSGSDSFGDLYEVERGPEGVVNRYRSHPDERYAFSLTPEFDSAFSRTPGGEGVADGWLTTDFRRLDVEARGIEAGRAAKQHRLFIDFDLDNDGERDGGTRLLLIDQPSLDLGGDWRRYLLDIASAFEARFPEEGEIRGGWRPRFEIEVSSNSDGVTSSWTLGDLRAHGNARLLLIHPTGIEPGERRRFELYFGGSDADPPAPPQVPSARLPVRAGEVEVAGVEPSWSDSGTLLSRPQRQGDGLLIVRWSAAGEVLARAELPAADPAIGLGPELLPAAGEVLEFTTLAEDGGHRFAFVADENGALFDHSARGVHETLPVLWSDSAPDWQIVDSDLSPDGRRMVVAERQYREDEALDDEVWFGRLRLLDQGGATVWSWPPEGEPSGTLFFSRFDPLGQRLFVAVQRTPIDDQDYQDSEVIAFDLTTEPAELLWRHTVGAGYDEPGRAVHRLVATDDGGVLYADWHGQIFRLDPDGATRWRGSVGGYALGLADDGAGGAYAFNFSAAFHLAADGSDEVVARRAAGTEGRALGISEDGVVAFADTHLTLVAPGAAEARPLLGRHPRVIAVSQAAPQQRVAVGASDGLLQVFGLDGVERWSQQRRGTMVADLAFLSDGTLIVAREVFAYDPDTMWRYRTLVEAFGEGGEPLWRSAGPWHRQPAMARISLDEGETTIGVAGGELLRIELP